MTSKNLFFKLIKQDFQKRIWCPILIFIGCFLALEVQLLMMLDHIEKQLNENNRYYYRSLGEYVEKCFFGTNVKMFAVLACFTAFLCAISGFSYLHSKVQLDTYHSLPVKREQLFLSKYVSGALQFFVPFVLHMFVCMGIAAGKDAFSGAAFANAIRFIGVILLVFLLAYAVFIMAACLTGNIIVSMIGSAVLFFYSTIVSLLVNGMFEKFFYTFTLIGGNANLIILENFWGFSPFTMLIRLFSQNTDEVIQQDNYFRYNAGYLWVIAVAVLVYTLIAFVLYKKRASESAGRAIAFKWAEPVIKTLVVIPAAFYSGLFFGDIASSDNGNAWYLFGVIFGYIIFALLIEVIFRLDIKSALCHKSQLVFNAACVAIIFVIFRYDALGYDTYVPADSELISCSVSIDGLMACSPPVIGRNYYVHRGVDDYRMQNVKMQGNPSVMELARKAAASGYSYDDSEGNYRSMLFGYNLKNGKSVYRRYVIDITDEETRKLLADIYNDSSYKTGTNLMLNDGWKREYKKLYCTGNFNKATLEMTPEFQSKLLETYQEEYLHLDFSTVLDTYPIGCITPVTQDEYNADMEWGYFHGSSGRTGDGSLIYPQFTKTIALLKENGFDIYEAALIEDINYIAVEYKRETIQHIGENEYISYDYVNIADIYDKEQQQLMFDSMLNTDYGWQVKGYTNFFEEDFEIYIHTKSDNSSVPENFNFKKGIIPEFIYETEGYKKANS